MRSDLTAETIRLSGSYSAAIDNAMEIWRGLWTLAFAATREIPDKRGFVRSLDVEQFRQISVIDPSVIQPFFALLRASEPPLIYDSSQGGTNFHLFALRPLEFVRRTMGSARADADLRYFIQRNIRLKRHCALSPQTAQQFAAMVAAINSHLTSGTLWGGSPQKGESPLIWHYQNQLLPCLENIFSERDLTASTPSEVISAFVETCLMVGYFEAFGKKTGYIRFSANLLETEYLLANLFGMPTSIRGFDTLFGSGLLLPENDGKDPGLPARTILIKGRFGTGKTLLSLQLAVEVARKGGVAWVIPLEQSVQECLYTLESMGLIRDCRISVATDPVTAVKLLKDRVSSDQGVLVLLKSSRESFGNFLGALQGHSNYMAKFPLRLLTADPINSVVRDSGTSSVLLRQKMADTLWEIRKLGTNIALVAEEGSEQTDELSFEQNIADTVIRLSVEPRHDYTQRFFEITKSRLQREQRGVHPFSIRPGLGIRIFPSSAAVSARIAPRRQVAVFRPIHFGLPSVDSMLGKEAIGRGDIIVLQGPAGSHKTPLGLTFLLGGGKSDSADADENDDGRLERRRPCALLIAARDDELTIRMTLEESFLKPHLQHSSLQTRDVRIRTLSQAYIHPGSIFQQLEDEIVDAKLSGHRINRVMFDNISHWEISCPFIRADETFGDTLVRFLRRLRVTSLIICGETTAEKRSVLQQSILDNADTVIQLERPMFRGVQQVMVRVLKTRGVDYRKEASELVVTDQGLTIKSGSPLLRFERDGEARIVRTRLFLHSESSAQSDYNSERQRALEAVLSTQVDLDSVDRLVKGNVTRLGAFSAIDELQVWQLDEFQCPDVAHGDQNEVSLHPFPNSALGTDNDPAHLIERLAAKCGKGKKEFYVVPYFEDISLLAYRPNSEVPLTRGTLGSWKALAAACGVWERMNPGDGVFFDFPKEVPENYNCLFLEILLSLAPPPPDGRQCALSRWLQSKDAVTAGILFRKLARKAFKLSQNAPRRSEHRASDQHKTGKILKVDRKAFVWRHWYSTLNQMLTEMTDPGERKSIHVSSLPGNIAIAGEWYLGIPAHSAAPSIGLEIVKHLTTRQAELDRMHKGVGLPTRNEFYVRSMGSSIEMRISPYVSMSMKTLGSLVKNAFSRSLFGCYSKFSEILSYHLQSILDIENEKKVESSIRSILKDLEARIRFVSTVDDCGNCPVRRMSTSNSKSRKAG